MKIRVVLPFDHTEIFSEIWTLMGVNDQEIQLEESGPKFDPPLYIQRYDRVRNLLRSEDIQKVR